MHKIDTTGHVLNRFSDGNPLTGQPATVVDASIMNALVDELVYVIEQAGITLVKGTNTQLRAAILAMITGGGEEITAESVSVLDSGGNFAEGIDNVEECLAELAARIASTFAASKIRRSVVALSGAANNAVVGHLENYVEVSHGSATVYTVPPDDTLTAAIGSTIMLFQVGAGKVEVVGASGVTIYRPAAFNAKSMQQHAAMVLAKVAANTWRLGGTLEAAA